MKKSLLAFSLFALAMSFQSAATAGGDDRLDQSIEAYQGRYPLSNVYNKLVDNHGDGFEPLYGVRNFRAVLNGVVYRGGANNAYNKHGKRNNSNPLPDEGLRNLCEEGFGTSVYLYSTRYNTAPHKMSCTTIFGERNTLDYQQESVLSNEDSVRAVLKLVHARLVSNTDTSPIYLHCWNGWHASGYISTAIFRQFCGWSAEQGVAYWNKNTDGHNGKEYEGIRRKIRNFQPFADLGISHEIRKKVCPNL